MTPARLLGIATVLLIGACALPATRTIALDDIATVEAGGETLIEVLNNDRPTVGESLTVDEVSGAVGSVSVEGGTRIAYRAPVGFAGDDVFSYTIRTGSGETLSANVVVTVVEPEVIPDPDTTAPQIVRFDVPELVSTQDEVVVAIEASDPESGVELIEISASGEIVATCVDDVICEMTIGPLADGVVSVGVTVADGAGNRADDERTVTIDGVRPTIDRITIEPDRPHSEQPFDVSVDANDANGLSVVTLLVDGREVTSCPDSPCAAIDIGPMSPGRHRLDVTAVDVVGNETSTEETFAVARALPDLVVESFEMNGAGERGVDGTVLVPATVVIRNVGAVAAGPFEFSARDTFLRPMTVDGSDFNFTPFVDGLAPGEARRFELVIRFNASFRSPTRPGDVVIEVDSCASREFFDDWCDVLELDEENNTSLSVDFDVVPVAVITTPSEDETIIVGSGTVDVVLDGSETFDPDGEPMRYEWALQSVTEESLILALGSEDELTVTLDRTLLCTDVFRFILSATDQSGHVATTTVEGIRFACLR